MLHAVRVILFFILLGANLIIIDANDDRCCVCVGKGSNTRIRPRSVLPMSIVQRMTLMLLL